MNREGFIRALRERLTGKLPAGELEDVISYYQEYFDDAGSEHEDVAAAELGSPESVANRILEEQNEGIEDKTPQAESKGNKHTKIIAGIIAAAVAVVIGPILLMVLLNTPARRDEAVIVVPSAKVEITPMPITTPQLIAPMPVPTAKNGIVTLENWDLTDFNQISVSLDIGEIILEEGLQFGIGLSWHEETGEIHYRNENGTIKVWSDIPKPVRDAYGGQVRITVPAGSTLNTVELYTALGGINISDVSVTTLEVSSALGKVDIRDSSAGEVNIKTALGEVTVKDCTVTGELDVEAALGDIDVSGDLRCEIDIEAALGEVTFQTLLAKSEYAYEMNATVGTVKVDGEKLGTYALKRSGKYELSISNSGGDITASFEN